MQKGTTCSSSVPRLDTMRSIFEIRFWKCFQFQANFYESARGVDQETTELFFFTVFRWNVVALLVVAYFICCICSVLLGRNARKHRVFGLFVFWISKITFLGLHFVIEKLVAAFFLISVTLLVFHHNAGFQGNNFIVRKAKETFVFQYLQNFETQNSVLFKSLKREFVEGRERR